MGAGSEDGEMSMGRDKGVLSLQGQEEDGLSSTGWGRGGGTDHRPSISHHMPNQASFPRRPAIPDSSQTQNRQEYKLSGF